MQFLVPIVALSRDDRLLESMQEFRSLVGADHTYKILRRTEKTNKNVHTKLCNFVQIFTEEKLLSGR